MKKEGFILIELIVAVALFAVVATICAGLMISISDTQQKVLSLRIAQDNLSYAIDTIGKEIRTGAFYQCGGSIPVPPTNPTPANCPSGDSLFVFKSATGAITAYQSENQRLKKTVNGVWQYLTSPDLIIIDQLMFYVVGALPKTAGDNNQPRVTIILRGKSGTKAKTTSQINIQTTISQRKLDSGI